MKQHTYAFSYCSEFPCFSCSPPHVDVFEEAVYLIDVDSFVPNLARARVPAPSRLLIECEKDCINGRFLLMGTGKYQLAPATDHCISFFVNGDTDNFFGRCNVELSFFREACHS